MGVPGLQCGSAEKGDKGFRGESGLQGEKGEQVSENKLNNTLCQLNNNNNQKKFSIVLTNF